jgi:hypothetical protein
LALGFGSSDFMAGYWLASSRLALLYLNELKSRTSPPTPSNSRPELDLLAKLVADKKKTSLTITWPVFSALARCSCLLTFRKQLAGAEVFLALLSWRKPFARME